MSEALPSFKEIETLHRKYAPTGAVFELVWTHCHIVRDVAMQLAESSGTKINAELTEVGCLLHDIGVYPLFNSQGFESNPKEYITHGVRGEEILEREGFSRVLCRFASHHTGAGLTKEQIVTNGLPLPHEDFLAETPEERLVMYADKFHSKTEPPYFNSWDYYADYVRRFGEGSIGSFAGLTAQFGKPDLAPLMVKYGHALRDLKAAS